MFTHNADGVKETVLDESFGKARAIAAPTVRMTVTHGAEHPREVNPSAAT